MFKEIKSYIIIMLERLYKKYLKNISEINKNEFANIFIRTKQLKKELLLFFRKAKQRQYMHEHRDEINKKQKEVMKRLYHSNKNIRDDKIKKAIQRYEVKKMMHDITTRPYDKFSESDNIPLDLLMVLD
jgi:hypothetical protein